MMETEVRTLHKRRAFVYERAMNRSIVIIKTTTKTTCSGGPSGSGA
jgi:hypothetical protein